jgi:hypothetical protein
MTNDPKPEEAERPDVPQAVTTKPDNRTECQRRIDETKVLLDKALETLMPVARNSVDGTDRLTNQQAFLIDNIVANLLGWHGQLP